MAGRPFSSGQRATPASATTLKTPSWLPCRYPSSAGQPAGLLTLQYAPRPPWLRRYDQPGASPASLPQALHRRAAAGDAFEPFPQRPGRLDVVAVVGEQPVARRRAFGRPGIGGAAGPAGRFGGLGISGADGP